MKNTAAVLDEFGVKYDKAVISAHRMPEEMMAFAKDAVDNGIEVIIAGAGGAAHLPGMVAANTVLPVIGVPVQSRALNGLGFVVIDRPDASGGSSRNDCDRRSRC